MTFCEVFFGGKHPFGEHCFGRGCVGFEPKPALLDELRTAVRTLLESSIDRVRACAGGEPLVAEIQYQLESLAKGSEGEPGDWDCEQTHPPGDPEIADAIQRFCNYLGPHLCGIRWAAERRMSKRHLRDVSKSMENLSRQDFQTGIRLYETKEYTLARESFQNVLASCPTDYFAHQYLGLIAAHLDKSSEALAHFESAHSHAESDAHRALALSHLARCYHALGESEQAVASAKKAAEVDGSAAMFWEYAVYSAVHGDPKPVLPAVVAAMQKDWVFWSIAAVDPQLDGLRGQIAATMNDVRDRIGKRSKEMYQQLRELYDGIQQLGGLEIGPLDKRIEDLERQQTQNNVYLFRDLEWQLDAVLKRVTRSARDTVHEKIAAHKRGLKKTNLWRERQLDQIALPVNQLRQQQRMLGSTLRTWNAGCFTYTAIWGAYTFAVATLIEKPGDIGANVVPYLLGFIVPFLLPAAVNGVNYWVSVKAPRRALELRIRELETQANPAVETVEKEYATRKETIAGELQKLETLMERIRRAEAAA